MEEVQKPEYEQPEAQNGEEVPIEEQPANYEAVYDKMQKIPNHENAVDEAPAEDFK